MISFEREIREYLTRARVAFEDHGEAYDVPDFKIIGRTTTAWVEVKEKRQVYDASVWPLCDTKESDAFILDELTARKLFNFGSTSCLFVRDNTTGLYYFSDPIALFLMPRTRCVREYNGFMKGKWVLNLKNFMGSDKLSDMFVFMRDWMNEYEGLVHRNAALHRPDFINETITVAGTPRTEEQQEHDVNVTR